jgi:hypothetical protein
MFLHKLPKLSLLTLGLAAAPAAWSATPASGELNDENILIEWDGAGPYLFTNVTPFAGGADTVQCDPSIPALCDVFTLNVNISEDFRGLEENQRETVRIGITFPQDPAGQVDYDLYVYDSAGNLIGDSAASAPQTSETVSVPLKTLKNGSYEVHAIPFTPLGTNYAGAAQVGKNAAKSASAFSVAPLVGSAPMTVTFDARALSAQPPAGGYVFDFGDGSLPVTDADGVIEHTYQADGTYLARVRFTESTSGKTFAGAAQTLFVGPLNAGSKSNTLFGGAFGAGALLALSGLACAGLRRRAARG